MKISIVSISYMNHRELLRTRRSVLAQKLPEGVELEHVIVLGDRWDDVPEFAGATVAVRDPKGCYDAMNAGLELCTGDVIGLLHAGDVFVDDNVLADVAENFRRDEVDFVFGDIYFSKYNGSGCSRTYSSARFNESLLEKGFMPPHPTFFIRKEVYDAVGRYDISLRIASDFDFCLRLFGHEPAYRYKRLDRIMVCMEPGGISTRWYNRLFVSVFEKYRALKKNTGSASYFKLMGRYYYYFFQ